jgi:asparagine synthetase B (glutamine-hydrolysing)
MFEPYHEEFSSIKEPEYLTNKEEIIPELSRLLLQAIKNIPEDTIGIAFSGGVDSALLALLTKKAGKKVKLYTVGLEGAKDLDHAMKCAAEMQWPIKIKVFTHQQAEEVIKKTRTILEASNAELNTINLGVGAVVYAVLELAKEDNITTVLGGLGAEEIFAGYMRHCDYGKNFSSSFVKQAMIQGLKDMEIRDLARDLPLANHFGIKIITPFLDQELVRYAMKIHPQLKINNDKKKIILRDVARYLGVPQEQAERKKVAAQYGSGFSKLINNDSLKR